MALHLPEGPFFTLLVETDSIPLVSNKPDAICFDQNGPKRAPPGANGTQKYPFG